MPIRLTYGRKEWPHHNPQSNWVRFKETARSGNRPVPLSGEEKVLEYAALLETDHGRFFEQSVSAPYIVKQFAYVLATEPAGSQEGGDTLPYGAAQTVA